MGNEDIFFLILIIYFEGHAILHLKKKNVQMPFLSAWY